MAESAVKGHWDAPGGEVREVTVPADARKLCTLAHVGYEDAFPAEVGAPGARTPEEWIRLIIELAPAAVRRALWPGWTAIGLKLHPMTDRESVLGWGSPPQHARVRPARRRIPDRMPAQLPIVRRILSEAASRWST